MDASAAALDALFAAVGRGGEDVTQEITNEQEEDQLLVSSTLGGVDQLAVQQSTATTTTTTTTTTNGHAQGDWEHVQLLMQFGQAGGGGSVGGQTAAGGTISLERDHLSLEFVDENETGGGINVGVRTGESGAQASTTIDELVPLDPESDLPPQDPIARPASSGTTATSTTQIGPRTSTRQTRRQAALEASGGGETSTSAGPTNSAVAGAGANANANTTTGGKKRKRQTEGETSVPTPPFTIPTATTATTATAEENSAGQSLPPNIGATTRRANSESLSPLPEEIPMNGDQDRQLGSAAGGGGGDELPFMDELDGDGFGGEGFKGRIAEFEGYDDQGAPAPLKLARRRNAKPNLSEDQRRENHASSEQRRRDAIRIGYEELSAIERSNVNVEWPGSEELIRLDNEAVQLEIEKEQLRREEEVRRERERLDQEEREEAAAEAEGLLTTSLRKKKRGLKTRIATSNPKPSQEFKAAKSERMLSKALVLRKGAALAKWLGEGNAWLQDEVNRLEELLNLDRSVGPVETGPGEVERLEELVGVQVSLGGHHTSAQQQQHHQQADDIVTGDLPHEGNAPDHPAHVPGQRHDQPNQQQETGPYGGTFDGMDIDSLDLVGEGHGQSAHGGNGSGGESYEQVYGIEGNAEEGRAIIL